MHSSITSIALTNGAKNNSSTTCKLYSTHVYPRGHVHECKPIPIGVAKLPVSSKESFHVKAGLTLSTLYKQGKILSCTEAHQLAIENEKLNNICLALSELGCASFYNSQIQNANFMAASMHLSLFVDIDFSSANFSLAKLANSTFRNCNLTYTDFSHADLEYCWFLNCNLTNAKLNTDISTCDFDRCKGLETSVEIESESESESLAPVA